MKRRKIRRISLSKSLLLGSPAKGLAQVANRSELSRVFPRDSPNPTAGKGEQWSLEMTLLPLGLLVPPNVLNLPTLRLNCQCNALAGSGRRDSGVDCGGWTPSVTRGRKDQAQQLTLKPANNPIIRIFCHFPALGPRGSGALPQVSLVLAGQGWISCNAFQPIWRHVGQVISDGCRAGVR